MFKPHLKFETQFEFFEFSLSLLIFTNLGPSSALVKSIKADFKEFEPRNLTVNNWFHSNKPRLKSWNTY